MRTKRKPPKKSAPGHYDVGYGKPPVHSRFKPGRSGHPGGRKRGQRNFKTIVLGIFEAEIELAVNGKRSKQVVAEALLLRLVQAGLKDGDIRAISRSLDLYERFADNGEDPTSDAPDDHDIDIIRRAIHGDGPHEDNEDADGRDELDDSDEPGPTDGGS